MDDATRLVPDWPVFLSSSDACEWLASWFKGVELDDGYDSCLKNKKKKTFMLTQQSTVERTFIFPLASLNYCTIVHNSPIILS